jgi:acyl-CoA thioesterase FadM
VENDAFYYEIPVLLKDTNLYSTAYFSRYFEWQGVCRELYFTTVENFQEVMGSGIELITKKAWVDYIKQIFVFDIILVKVQNANIKRCSFDMIFTFINKRTKEIVAKGGQTLTFAVNKKIVRIPDGIVNVIKKHPYK